MVENVVLSAVCCDHDTPEPEQEILYLRIYLFIPTGAAQEMFKVVELCAMILMLRGAAAGKMYCHEPIKV